ncbi:MAG: tetratricopeptide repeat protein [Capsulimonadaceae bacterium]
MPIKERSPRQRGRRNAVPRISAATSLTPARAGRYPYAIAIVLVLITAMVFCRAPGNDFINYDDDLHVYNNKLINPVTPAGVWYFWDHPLISRNQADTKVYEQLYAPVFFTTYAILAGPARLSHTVNEPGLGTYTLNPAVYHTTNVVLHAVNVLLVFGILLLLVGNEWAAAAGALLFGIHPVQVEPVSWVTGLNNILSGCFGLSALWLYLLNLTDPKSKERTLREVGGTVLFVLALLTKPISIVFVFVAWVLGVLVLRKPVAECTRSLAVWAGIMAVCVIVNEIVQPKSIALDPNINVPAPFRAVISLNSFGFYLYKLVIPVNLAVDYGRTPRFLYNDHWTAVVALVPIVLAALAWWVYKSQPMVSAGIVVFFASLLPMSGIVPYYFHSTSVVADRYLYLSVFGPALVLAALLAKAPSKLWYAVAGVILVALAGLAYRQTMYWHNSETLYRHALSVNPHSQTISYNYGTMLAQQERYTEAIPHLAVAAKAGRHDAMENMALALDGYGNVLAKSGQVAQGMALFNQAVQYNPNLGRAHADLAIGLSRQGDVDGAIRELQTAVTLDPSNAEDRKDLSLLEQVQAGKKHLATPAPPPATPARAGAIAAGGH